MHDSACSTEDGLIVGVRKAAALPAPSPAALAQQPLADGHINEREAETVAAETGPSSGLVPSAGGTATSAPDPVAHGAVLAVNGSAAAPAAPAPFLSPFQSPFAAANRSGQTTVRLALRSASVDAVTRQQPPVPPPLSSSGAYSDSFPRSGSGSLRSPALSATAHADGSIQGSTIQSDGTTVGTTSSSEAAAQPQLPPEETVQVLNLLMRLFDAFAVLITLPNPARTYIRCVLVTSSMKHVASQRS